MYIIFGNMFESGASVTGFLYRRRKLMANIAFFAVFLVQASSILYSRITRQELNSSMRKVPLASITLPVIFKICLKPGFDKKRLQEMGYPNIIHYFYGSQLAYKTEGFGKFLGWGGFSKNGSVIKTAAG